VCIASLTARLAIYDLSSTLCTASLTAYLAIYELSNTLCTQPAPLPVSIQLKPIIGPEYFVPECVFMTLLVAVLQHLVTVIFRMQFDKDTHTEVSQILAKRWPYPARTFQTLFRLTAAFNTAP